MRWILGFFAMVGCLALIIGYTSFRGLVPVVIAILMGYLVVSRMKS